MKIITSVIFLVLPMLLKAQYPYMFNTAVHLRDCYVYHKPEVGGKLSRYTYTRENEIRLGFLAGSAVTTNHTYTILPTPLYYAVTGSSDDANSPDAIYYKGMYTGLVRVYGYTRNLLYCDADVMYQTNYNPSPKKYNERLDMYEDNPVDIYQYYSDRYHKAIADKESWINGSSNINNIPYYVSENEIKKCNGDVSAAIARREEIYNKPIARYAFYQEALFDPTWDVGDFDGINIYYEMPDKAFYAPDALYYESWNEPPKPMHPGLNDSVYFAISYTYSDTYGTYISVVPWVNFDLNNDNRTNSADIVAIYNYILTGGGDKYSRGYMDVNKDGNVNSTDIVAIYNHIINGNEPPQSPPAD